MLGLEAPDLLGERGKLRLRRRDRVAARAAAVGEGLDGGRGVPVVRNLRGAAVPAAAEDFASRGVDEADSGGARVVSAGEPRGEEQDARALREHAGAGREPPEVKCLDKENHHFLDKILDPIFHAGNHIISQKTQSNCKKMSSQNH